MKGILLIFIFTVSISLQNIGFSQSGKNTDTYYQTSDVQPLMQQYEADKGSLTRFYIIQNSPERRERFLLFNRDYLKQLNELDFNKMNTSARVDYLLLNVN